MAGIADVLTVGRLRQICPKAAPDILEAIVSGTPGEFARAGITDHVHLAHFVAQIATETGGLVRLDENLNYTSAARIRAVFPKRVTTDAMAKALVRNPRALANHVYGGRNGNTAPDDGWNYRGSGLIRLTGKGNFADMEKLTGQRIVADPDLVRQPDSALEIALAYWTKRKISMVAGEATDAAVEAVTRLVNPAMLGLDTRKRYFRKAVKALAPPKTVALAPALVAAAPPGAFGLAPAAAAAGPELSGPQWAARFPTSRSIADLAAPFSTGVAAFVAALKAANADVQISATYRPKERAYLMHWAWLIGKGDFDPAGVPPMPSIAILWQHPTLAKSRAAARAMVAAYGMVQVAALNSRHTERRAIDMTIRWNGALDIKAHDGAVTTIKSQPRNGSNKELIGVGAGYGVIKLPSDPPHWSDDGR